MATYRFDAFEFFVPEDFTSEFFLSPSAGFPISGSGTFASPWLVEAGDFVGFVKTGTATSGTVTNAAIFTNNFIPVNTTSVTTREVASGSTLLDAVNWGFGTYYFRRDAPALDTTPDQFSLGADVNNTTVSTNTFRSFQVTGVNTEITAVASATGTGVCKVGPTASGPWLDSVGGIDADEIVYCRFTSPTGASSSSTYTVTIGSVSDSINITTAAPDDGTPDAFTFNPAPNAEPSTAQTSNLITITGINIPVAVSITGGTYSKNTGTYASGAGTAVNGDTFRVQHLSSSAFSTPVNTTLTVGGVSDTFTSTTRAIDDDPNPFSLGNNQPNLGRSTTVPLQTFTIAGMDTGATITVTGSGTAATQVSKNNVDFFTSLTGITNGDQIYSRGTTSASYSSNTTATVTANGVSDSVTLTTESNPTAGNNEIPFPVTSGNPISIDDIATFFAGTSASRPDNLGAFYRGGSYVPNITTNNNIPTTGAISMSDFYGSATEFTFVMLNSYKSAAVSEGTGTQTLNLFWSFGDWDVGPGGALDSGTEYRYSNFTITNIDGQATTPQVTSGTQTFSTGNTTFTVSVTVAQQFEFFAYGTLTIEARPPSSPSTVVSRQVSWAFTVFGTL